MLIERIGLKFGPAPNTSPVAIDAPGITLFVGPNNSGKSRILQEIFGVCHQGTIGDNKLLDAIAFSELSEETAAAALEAIRLQPQLNDRLNPANVLIRNGPGRVQMPPNQYIQARVSPNATDHRRIHFAEYHARHLVLNLSGTNRLEIARPKDRGDLKAPSNSFARLLNNNDKRTALRQTIFEALGLYLGFDISNGDKIELRFGTTPPPNERSIEEQTLTWMASALSHEEVSDGVKAFAGMLIELRAGDPEVILIDEPEAFLHPALCFKLGKSVAQTAAEGQKQLFISTHSPQFMMGVLNSGASVNIVRLTYHESVGTARLLPKDDVTGLMRDPLLRSANAMAGIFYENVVVTEADADRAFYQEINERLLDALPPEGIANALFVNGNGKDTVHRIVAPLRKLGIPAAVILDIDALGDGGNSWSAHLNACQFPRSRIPSLQRERAEVWKLLTAGGRDPKREGGVKSLEPEDSETAESYLQALAKYGLFLVPNGEVEQWLPGLDVVRNKTWLRDIFRALGDVRGSGNYVEPSAGDVWDFLREIAVWAGNSKRKGTGR